MNEINVATIIAGAISGLLGGFVLISNEERTARNQDRDNRSKAKAILWSETFQLYCSVVAIVVVTVIIQNLGGAYPLSQLDKYLYVASLIIFAVLAKYLRFKYWKTKNSKP